MIGSHINTRPFIKIAAEFLSGWFALTTCSSSLVAYTLAGALLPLQGGELVTHLARVTFLHTSDDLRLMFQTFKSGLTCCN